MQTHFLGRISFHDALRAQDEAFQSALKGQGTVLGFECEPVITLGLRALEGDDLTSPRTELEVSGFEVVTVDRGGQATVHNPGQLVIFPVLELRERRAREWVCNLARTTRACLADFGVASEWDEGRPGIYTLRGKIASIGIRVRQRISTHGVAINVSNDLRDFQYIRACGVSSAPMDRVGGDATPSAVFATWMEHFQLELTR